MRILIAGATGMVGRNIKEHDLANNHIILSPTREELDLTNKLEIRNYLNTYKPEFLINAAGFVGGIHANISKPSKFLLENITIGCNLINESANYGIKNIMNLGSSCMYPKNAINPLRENSLLQGYLEPTNEGYAIAKIAVQRLCVYLHNEDKSRNYVTLMPCNLYGKYDSFNPNKSHLIASAIVKLHQAKHNNESFVEIWGDGTVRREFMYSEDIANAVWFLLPIINKLPNVINVGTGVDYSILDYYKRAAKIVNYTGDFKFDLSKPTGMKKKLLDVQKIKDFGWNPKFSLDYGLKVTYEHYLESLK